MRAQEKTRNSTFEKKLCAPLIKRAWEANPSDSRWPNTDCPCRSGANLSSIKPGNVVFSPPNILPPYGLACWTSQRWNQAGRPPNPTCAPEASLSVQLEASFLAGTEHFHVGCRGKRVSYLESSQAWIHLTQGVRLGLLSAKHCSANIRARRWVVEVTARPHVSPRLRAGWRSVKVHKCLASRDSHPCLTTHCSDAPRFISWSKTPFSLEWCGYILGLQNGRWQPFIADFNSKVSWQINKTVDCAFVTVRQVRRQIFTQIELFRTRHASVVSFCTPSLNEEDVSRFASPKLKFKTRRCWYFRITRSSRDICNRVMSLELPKLGLFRLAVRSTQAWRKIGSVLAFSVELHL